MHGGQSSTFMSYLEPQEDRPSGKLCSMRREGSLGKTWSTLAFRSRKNKINLKRLTEKESRIGGGGGRRCAVQSPERRTSKGWE